jgi:hypothetical protein
LGPDLPSLCSSAFSKENDAAEVGRFFSFFNLMLWELLKSLSGLIPSSFLFVVDSPKTFQGDIVRLPPLVPFLIPFAEDLSEISDFSVVSGRISSTPGHHSGAASFAHKID